MSHTREHIQRILCIFMQYICINDGVFRLFLYYTACLFCHLFYILKGRVRSSYRLQHFSYSIIFLCPKCVSAMKNCLDKLYNLILSEFLNFPPDKKESASHLRHSLFYTIYFAASLINLCRTAATCARVALSCGIRAPFAPAIMPFSTAQAMASAA